MKISDVVRFRLVLHFQLSSWWLCKRATLRQDGWSSRRETCHVVGRAAKFNVSDITC